MTACSPVAETSAKGRADGFRRALARPILRPLRDLLVRIAWRLDPDLEALEWSLLPALFSSGRVESFRSWLHYDQLEESLRGQLQADREWRTGPDMSWKVGSRALRARSFVDGECRKALDFGCGADFPLATGILLHVFGVEEVLGVDPVVMPGYWRKHRLLGLVRWIEDGCLVGDPLFSDVDRARVEWWHRELMTHETPSGDWPVRLLDGGLEACHGRGEQFDLITSRHVFEHLEDPGRAWRALWRCLRSGAVLHAEIDLRDHRFYSEPRRIPPLPRARSGAEWRDEGTNGWRFKEWRGLFAETPEARILELRCSDLAGCDMDPSSSAGAGVAEIEVLMRREASP
jgi:SAM-dependent methyltransferase